MLRLRTICSMLFQTEVAGHESFLYLYIGGRLGFEVLG
jgi:hypothetical protein